MMFMTAKVNLRKILLILGILAAVILAGILMLGGGTGDASATVSLSASSNDGRVQFLKDFGWDVTTSPKESGQVKIPEESSPVFTRYNTLQKGQGYDLSAYAGKNVMRYVYQINNYPGATQPVYATVLVYKDQIIGGDITNTAAHGKISGFKLQEKAATVPSSNPEESTVSKP